MILEQSVIVSTVSPSISHEVMEPDAMISVFWMLSFKEIEENNRMGKTRNKKIRDTCLGDVTKMNGKKANSV